MVVGIGLQPHDYGTHLLEPGVNHLQGTGNLRPVQFLLDHAEVDSTVRYLGLTLRMP